MSKSSTSVTS